LLTLKLLGIKGGLYLEYLFIVGYPGGAVVKVALDALIKLKLDMPDIPNSVLMSPIFKGPVLGKAIILF
jgi:hypothetical protein